MCLSKYRILSRGDSRKRTSVGSETNTGCVKILDSDAWFLFQGAARGTSQAGREPGGRPAAAGNLAFSLSSCHYLPPFGQLYICLEN